MKTRLTVGHATRCDLGAAKSDREAVPFGQSPTLRERNIALLDTAHQRIKRENRELTRSRRF
ncbi:MAG: hypothetical protein F6K26_39375, partial [Moorea sp. SIO2I5]|nr:hypothetical protein [Moorena sp. SIO2I5]